MSYPNLVYLFGIKAKFKILVCLLLMSFFIILTFTLDYLNQDFYNKDRVN